LFVYSTNSIGSYAPTWIKVDPRSMSLGSSKLLNKVSINKIRHDIEGATTRWIYFSVSDFLIIFQIFNPEVTLIHDQFLINVAT